MSASISVSETVVFTAVRAVLSSFGLTTTDPSGVFPIVRGQQNRVSMPAQIEYLVLWPLMRTKLATNVDTDTDAQITGSITNSILSVVSLSSGLALLIGSTVSTTNIADPPCTIIRQIDGNPGGVGRYAVTTTPDLSSQTLYAGTHQMLSMLEMTIQCDIHGPSSADNATIISTIFRDDYAVQSFFAQGLDIAPLYADDARQIPFTNAEDQWEERWSLDLHLQINPIVTVSQQFAAQLSVILSELG